MKQATLQWSAYQAAINWLVFRGFAELESKRPATTPPPPHSFLLLISLQFPLSTKPKSIKNWKNLTNRKHWPPSKTINKFNSCLGQLINGIFEQIDNMNSDFLNIFANITDQLKTLALCQNSHLPKKATPL